MYNKYFWEILQNLGKKIATFTDDLWKIWRWFGVGFIAFAAFDPGTGLSVLAFGVVVTSVGVLSLVGWLFSSLIGGLTEKGKNTGKWRATLTASFLFVLAIFFAIYAWALIAVFAYPAFR